MLVFEDLQMQILKEFYTMFVKSTDTAFVKKQNSFILFKTGLHSSYKDKKTLYTLANCYFRLKNLVHESLPQLKFLSDLERDGDILRLKELENKNKISNLTQNLKELDAIIDKGTNTNPGEIDLNPEVEAWVCLLYTSPSPRDLSTSRMPSSA